MEFVLGLEDLVEEFNEMLRSSRDMAAAVAAVTVLANYIKRSKASTVMELEKDLTSAADKLERSDVDLSSRPAISMIDWIGINIRR